MTLPVARQDGLVVRELPDETLVFDLRANKAHVLNRASALVWRRCDGRTGPAELAAALRDELGVPDGEAAAQLALEQLSRRGLLERPVEAVPPEERIGRREALRKLAILGALPLVMTIAAPHRSAAKSFPCTTNNPCAPFGKTTSSGVCQAITPFSAKGTACTNGKCDGNGTCVQNPATTNTPTTPTVDCTKGVCTNGSGACTNIKGCKCSGNACIPM